VSKNIKRKKPGAGKKQTLLLLDAAAASRLASKGVGGWTGAPTPQPTGKKGLRDWQTGVGTKTPEKRTAREKDFQQKRKGVKLEIRIGGDR